MSLAAVRLVDRLDGSADRAGGRRLAAGGRSRTRHGGRFGSARRGDRRRHPAPRRQRDRRGGGDWLRRGGHQPVLRQSRRRRVPGRPSRQDRPRRLYRFPRDRAGGGDQDDVSRRRRRSRSKGRASTAGAPSPRRARSLGLDAALTDLRRDGPRDGHGAGDRAGARRLRPRRAPTPTSSTPSRCAFTAIPEAAKIFLRPDGSTLQPGDRLVQTDLAATLQAIADHGPDAFYRGAIAAKIDAAMRANGGIADRRRPRRLQDRRGRAARLRLPRLPLRLGAAAIVGRRDPVRDPQCPRGLRPCGARLPLGGQRPSDGRGDAPRLHGPQRLPRRPGVREEPARPPAQQGLRSADPRRHPARPGDAVAGGSAGHRDRTKRARRPISR